VLRSRRNDKLIAILAGIVLAGAPIAVIGAWTDRYIVQQGDAEVANAAKRAIVLAEGRIRLVISGLNDLATRGISTCSVEDIEAMYQTAFAISPIKEIAIVAPNGQAFCTSLGLPFGRQETVSRPVMTSAPDFVIEVVRIAGRSDPLVRVRHIAANGRESLAALLPADLLLPKVSPNAEAFRTYARLTTRDGTLIEEGGAALTDDESADDRIVFHERSNDYGLVVTTSMSRAALDASHAGLRLAGPATGLVILLTVVALRAYARRRKNPIVEIEHALKANEFLPYFQPILDIASGRLVGAEVLMRWRKSDGTIVAPASFIPLAESSGLIFDLTRALIRRACREVGTAIGRRPGMMISFNMTAKHFLDDATVSEVHDLFGASPIALSQVVLEVTERQPLDDLATARRVIASLQGLGVRVAIDDVGTGHGGLSYLLKLGVDIIKIDKFFIDAIGTERYSTTIIKSLCELARGMRMEIIAEGVENFSQVSYLRAQGVRYAQGYAFAPPLPCASFLQLLDAADPLPGDPAQADGVPKAPLRPASGRQAAA
jgi:sensor c-di-GMP phosphodiesterase-like protein